jgi:hypothetical protein
MGSRHYVFLKQRSAANIPDAAKKRQHSIKSKNLVQQMILPLILRSETAIHMVVNNTYVEPL